MSTINFLSKLYKLNGGDLIVVYASNQGDARQTSLTDLTLYMQDNLVFDPAYAQGQYVTCYSSPSITDFTVSLPTQSSGASDGQNIWLLLTPIGTFDNGTIIFPESTTLLDKQQLLISCTQIINTLTLNSNGATLAGGPTTAIEANGFLKLQYDKPTNKWYYVG